MIGILVLIFIATGIVLLILFKNRAAAKNNKSIYRKVNDDIFDESSEEDGNFSDEEAYDKENFDAYDDSPYDDGDDVKIYTKKK